MAQLTTFADRFVARDSLLHRVDARVKLPAALLYILAISMTREGAWGVLALLTLPIAIGSVLAGFSPRFTISRSILALPFVAAAVPLMFTRPGTPIATLPLAGWTVSREGIEAVATICAKSWLSVLVGVLLTGSTPVAETLRALRVLRVPRLLVTTVFFTYRYFFVIGDEAVRLMRARDSRSAMLPGRHAGRSVGWRAGVLGHMVGSLFARSLDRSERVYAAMQARGYHGDLRLLDNPPVRGVEVVGAAFVVAYAIGVQLAGRFA